MSQSTPIPFKAPPPEAVTGPDINPPTSLVDCTRVGGHGGPEGDRWYYATTGKKWSPDPDDKRICEICGTVNI